MKRKKIKIILLSVFILGSSLLFVAFNDKDFQIAKNLDIFVTLFRELNLYYVDNTDPQKLVESGIKGMLESLDPYTNFIAESDMDEFRFMTTGEYGGIGALIRKAGDYTIISEPYEGFPANKFGLHAGDTLITIDGISIKGKDISGVSELLKGSPNTPVDISVRRIGTSETISKTLTREKITISNVPYYGVVENNMGYIRLSNFTKDATKEVKDALIELKRLNVDGIILDLRNNPGGLLVEAVGVANLFVKKDQEIVSTRGKVKQWDHKYETSFEPVDTLIPLAILVNQGSASASEIVAGALQDLDRALIIGQRTFGKGLVQTTRPLSYNTQLKVTTAKYYIPSGRCIQALDYTHRNEDGSVGHIPDSLISEFSTLNGRKVYDGGGIAPDINIEVNIPANLTINLYVQNLIFDYSTLFTAKHDSIGILDSFYLSDNDYNNFAEFLTKKEFDYTTSSDDKLAELITIAKSEGYYELAEEEFNGLKSKLSHNLRKDLETYKKEISELLIEEIASRYYYQKGRLKVSLRDDEQLDKAVEMLKSPEIYSSILMGTYKPKGQEIVLK
ncbi:MAG: S41 family peptidase [Bacteroidales bacterium]|nr:S41 family peptidase [Bacteroidales bacterium]